MAHTSAPRTGAAVCRRDKMFATERKSLTVPVAIVAVALMLCGAFIAMSEQSQAAGEDLSGTYGEPYVIDIAPGYSWDYTATFPESLEGVKLSAQVNDLGSAVVIGEDTHTVDVTIPAETAAGSYNLVLKAFHEASNQTVYQYIQFNVQNGIVITPAGENLGNTVVGVEKQFTFTANTTFSTIDSITASINGLTVNEDYTISVSGNSVTVTITPTEDLVGAEQTITVTATAAAGEEKTVTNTFNVYRDLVLTPTNTTIGNQSNASTVINVPAGLDITFTGVDSLPAGVSWDEETRTLSVSSNAFIDQDITIGATSADGQTADNVVISVENESTTLAINTSESNVITYNDNAEDPQITVSLNEGSNSGIKANSYALGSTIDGVSIDAATGTVTIDSSTVATTNVGTTVTINAETNFGMAVTGSFTFTVEGDLTFSDENNSLILITDADHIVSSEVFNGAAENAEVTYDYQITGETQTGFTVSLEGNKLTVDSSTIEQVYQITVTAHTAGGQTESVVYTINTFAELIFTSEPKNDVGGQGI